MLINDFIDVLLINEGVPGFIRVDHHNRPQITAIKTTGGVNPNPALARQTQLFNTLLGILPHLTGMMILATGPAILTLIGAKKDMMRVITHNILAIFSLNPYLALPYGNKYTLHTFLIMGQSMPSQRHFTRLDHLLCELQNLLGAGSKNAYAPHRANPAANISEPPLNETERKLSAALMRVNHAGEIAAQGLYLGQSLSAKTAATRQQMRDAAAEEGDHLRWCEQRLDELHSHTSYLNPLWYTGSLAIGAIAGQTGDRWSYGFVEETERQVMKHLEGHLGELPAQDQKSRAIVEQMKHDEGEHAAAARAAGAAKLPAPIKKLMELTAKLMTISARYI